MATPPHPFGRPLSPPGAFGRRVSSGPVFGHAVSPPAAGAFGAPVAPPRGFGPPMPVIDPHEHMLFGLGLLPNRGGPFEARGGGGFILGSGRPLRALPPKLKSEEELPSAVEFVEEPPKELECNICLGVLQDAVVLKCQHLYCATCGLEALHSKPECPACRAPAYDSDLMPQYSIRGLVSGLKVRCPGCSETMAWGAVSKHQRDVCSIEACEFKANGCTASFPRGQTGNHKLECEYGPLGRKARCEAVQQWNRSKKDETRRLIADLDGFLRRIDALAKFDELEAIPMLPEGQVDLARDEQQRLLQYKPAVAARTREARQLVQKGQEALKTMVG